MVKYSSTILAAANLLAIVHAAPAQPVCKVVTETFTGHPVWVPQAEATSSTAWTTWDPKKPEDKTTTSASAWTTWDPKKPEDKTTSSTVWTTWDPKKPEDKTTSSASSWTTWDPKKPEDKTTSTSSWTTWDPKKPEDKTTSSSTSWSTWDPKSPKDETTTTSLFWGEWTTTTETSKTVTSGGGFYPHPTETTTKKSEDTTTYTHPTETKTYTTPEDTTHPSYTKPTETSTKTTSTPAPAVTTCAAGDHSTLSEKPEGSCGCDFTTHCNGLSYPGNDAVFWERKEGETVDSLAECLSICNENSACQAAIWTDSADAPARDFKHCYQVINLPQPATTGYGQLSYKGSCSGSCSKNYQTNGGA